MDTTLATDVVDQEKIHWLEVDGLRTRVYDAGEGEPLVLIHGGHFGGLCSAIESWTRNLPGFERRFRVLAFDKPGQGHTDNPLRDEDYTFDVLVSHAKGVLRQRGIRNAHVVGHSRGGLLATRLAIEEPGVRSLVIVDSNTTSPDPAMGAVFNAALERRLPAEAPVEEKTRMTVEAYSWGTGHMTPTYLESLAAFVTLPKSHEVRERMEQVRDSVWMPNLRATRDATFRFLEEQGLAMPVLVVWGYNDPSAPLSQGLQLLDLLAKKTAHLEFHVLNQAGHFSFREQPEAFNRIVTSFCLERGE